MFRRVVLGRGETRWGAKLELSEVLGQSRNLGVVAEKSRGTEEVVLLVNLVGVYQHYVISTSASPIKVLVANVSRQ